VSSWFAEENLRQQINVSPNKLHECYPAFRRVKVSEHLLAAVYRSSHGESIGAMDFLALVALHRFTVFLVTVWTRCRRGP